MRTGGQLRGRSGSPALTRRQYVLLHVTLGPIAGLPFAVAVVVVYAWVRAGAAASIGPGDLLTLAASLFAGALVPAIFIGIIPAAAHALIMLGISLVLQSRRLWMAMTPVVGGIVGGLCVLGLHYFGARNLAEYAPIMVVASSGAAVAVLVSAWKGGTLPPMRGEAGGLTEIPPMHDDGEPTLADRVRGALWAILGAAVTVGWLALQVLGTGAGCWIWAC